jgi:hypothetical protein
MAKAKLSKKTAGETAATPITPAPTPEPIATAAPVSASDTVKKPTIVASKSRVEGRANLLPINVEDEVRRLAYLLSERRGFEPGHEAEDWINAEREVHERYHQQSA